MLSHGVLRVFTQETAEIREPLQEVTGKSNLVTQTLTHYLTHAGSEKNDAVGVDHRDGQKEENSAPSQVSVLSARSVPGTVATR